MTTMMTDTYIYIIGQERRELTVDNLLSTLVPCIRRACKGKYVHWDEALVSVHVKVLCIQQCIMLLKELNVNTITPSIQRLLLNKIEEVLNNNLG